MTAPIVNGESGFVVREKLNLIIEQVDTLVASGGGGAADPLTGAEIKTANEGEADTNAFTDAEKTKLTSISGANTGDQDLSGLQVKPSEGAFADGDKTKLDTIGVGAEANTIDSSISGEPTGSTQIPNVVTMSQAEYDAAVVAATIVATTLYVII